MFKKVIKVILILLVIFLIILGVIWLIGRHKASESGSNPLSFRQFLGLSTKTNNAQAVVGSGASSFKNTNGLGNGNNSGGANGSSSGLGNGSGSLGSGSGSGSGSSGLGNGSGSLGSGSGNLMQTNVSQFTNGGSAPTGNLGLSGTDIGTDTAGAGNSSLNNNNGAGDTGDTGNSTTSSALVCGSADTNITFTAAQLAELNTLQNRFYALAQTLHTDADVATEVANHDSFALKADQVTELYNYCEAALPNITDPRLQQHLPTPFWHAWLASDIPGNEWNTSSRPDQDNVSFLDYDAFDRAHMEDVHDNNQDNPDTATKGPYGLLSFSNPQEVNVDGSALKSDTQLLVPVVERILRINLW